MALLLSCEKMSSLSNGVYLNGELIARMDGHIDGCTPDALPDHGIGLRKSGYYLFVCIDDQSGKYVHIEASREVWGSDYLMILIRDDRGTDWETIGRGLLIHKYGPDEEMSARYYETVTGRTLEEVSVARQVSGLLEIKEKKGAQKGKARVDISFTLSNGDEYQIVYRGEVNMNIGTYYV